MGCRSHLVDESDHFASEPRRVELFKINPVQCNAA